MKRTVFASGIGCANRRGINCLAVTRKSCDCGKEGAIRGLNEFQRHSSEDRICKPTQIHVFVLSRDSSLRTRAASISPRTISLWKSNFTQSPEGPPQLHSVGPSTDTQVGKSIEGVTAYPYFYAAPREGSHFSLNLIESSGNAIVSALA